MKVFLEELKKRNNIKPVIVLTSEGELGKMERAKQLGAKGWIVKPFDAEKFLSVVKLFDSH